MLFPELSQKRCAQINLDAEAQLWFAEQRSGEGNPLLDPSVCRLFIDACHRKYAIDFSFGGWMESRKSLWHGSYLDDDERYIHLGVDYNVPEGTGISIHHTSTVIRIDNDFPETHGWGNRIIVHDEQRDVMLVFAHLDVPTGVHVGDILSPGTIFAHVGTTSQNGGWFPHLHVQIICADFYRHLLRNDLRDLDGYGHEKDLETLKINFPNPLMYFAE